VSDSFNDQWRCLQSMFFKESANMRRGREGVRQLGVEAKLGWRMATKRGLRVKNWIIWSSDWLYRYMNGRGAR